MFRRSLILAGLLLGSLSQLGFSSRQQQVSSDQMGFWLILFIAAIVLIVLLWWALRGSARSARGYRPGTGQAEEPVGATESVPAVESAPVEAAGSTAAGPAAVEEAPAVAEPAPVAAAVEEAPAVVAEAVEAAPAEAPAAEAAAPDDLRRIEGIGPKVDAALRAMGITTFAQLAAADPDKLEADLRAAGVRIIPGAPKTWPEQAALAARGDWEGFEKLTGRLKGGRRAAE